MLEAQSLFAAGEMAREHAPRIALQAKAGIDATSRVAGTIGLGIQMKSAVEGMVKASRSGKGFEAAQIGMTQILPRVSDGFRSVSQIISTASKIEKIINKRL